MGMSNQIIQFSQDSKYAGFTQTQFRKLDQMYCYAVSQGWLHYRSIDCNFDEGIASYTYYLSAHNPPYLQFLIRKVGPKTTMYEIYKSKQGRILKSGLFERAFAELRYEIESLGQNDA